MSLLASGSAVAAPADFGAVSKVTMLNPDAKHRHFRTKLLSKEGGRVIGRCASYTGTGDSFFTVTCQLADGSITVRGKIIPVTSSPGYLRITGGTGAYSGVTGRRYHLRPGPQSEQVFFDFTPLRRESDLPFEPYGF